MSSVIGSIFLGLYYAISLAISLPILAILTYLLRKEQDRQRMNFYSEEVLMKEKIKHPFRIEGMGMNHYAQKLSDTELKRRMIFHPLDRSHNWFIGFIHRRWDFLCPDFSSL